MAKNNFITSSFVAGEVSPRFYGRVDTQQYNQGAEEITNLVVYPQGGVGRDTGFQHVVELTDKTGARLEDARAIPFSAADGTRWKIIITKKNPSLLDLNPYTDVTDDETEWYAINTKTGARVKLIPFLRFTGVTADYTDTYYDLEAKNINLNDFQYAQSGNRLFLVHPKLTPIQIIYTEIPDEANFIFKFVMVQYPGPNYSDIADPFRRMPYRDPVLPAPGGVTGLELFADGSGVLTLKKTSTSTLVLDSTWIGRYIKFTAATDVCVVKVMTDNGSGELGVVFLYGTPPAHSTSIEYATVDPDYFYELGYWDEISGWPRTVAFFESRLVFGGSKGFPDTEWLSKVNNINVMDQRGVVTDSDYTDPITSDDPFLTTLQDVLLNEIRWMYPGKTITTGTNRREFVVQGPNASATIAIDNIQTSAETPHGSAYVQAERIENATAFLQRDRRTIRELAYNFQEDSFKATNLSIIAEHMAKKTPILLPTNNYIEQGSFFVSIKMQEVPLGILWALDNNGRLSGLTREREQGVLAWHYRVLAGKSWITETIGDNDVDFEFYPQIKSISVIQTQTTDAGQEQELDELWITACRGIKNSVSGKYERHMFLEKKSQEWEVATINGHWSIPDDELPTGPVYMDQAIMTNDTKQTALGNKLGVVTQLPHSVGTIVGVVASGFWLGEFTVVSDGAGKGQIDFSAKILELDSYQAIIGYNYIGRCVPLVPEVPAQTGSSQALPRRVSKVTFNFHRAIGARYGRVKSEGQDNTPIEESEEINFPLPSEQDDPPKFFTGERGLDFPPGYEGKPKVFFESHLPFPMMVTHMVTEMVVYER